MAKSYARRAVAAAVFALAAVAVPTASASSGHGSPVAALTAKAEPCQGRVLSQPFAQWGDTADYFPVANGDFDNGMAGWTLTGGATVTGGGDPFVDGSDGASLDLPAGSSATTPASCVDLGSPTLRLFAAGAPSSRVVISVLVGSTTLAIGTINPSGAWAPTPAYLYVTNLLAALSPTGTVNASFRFSATAGDTTIDDVFIDPYRRT